MSILTEGPTDPPVIPHDASQPAIKLFESHYADVLCELPVHQLSYRIDVEQPEPGAPDGLLHQLVIFAPAVNATLRHWLRQDGRLVDLETGVVRAEALRMRLIKWEQQLAQQQLWTLQAQRCGSAPTAGQLTFLEKLFTPRGLLVMAALLTALCTAVWAYTRYHLLVPLVGALGLGVMLLLEHFKQRRRGAGSTGRKQRR
jgi:hypothetical protein